MDAESIREMLDRFYAAMRTEVEGHGGRVVKFTGDGVMAAFGVPDVHEDDAARAVGAAFAMRGKLDQLASDLSLELALNVGVNTGEVVVSESDDDVVGDAVNVAARLEGAATGGEILVGADTWRLTRSTSRYESVEPLTLKGKAEPVPAYRLISLDGHTAESAAGPFIGRESELGRLRAAFEDAVDANAARLVTIIGSPGLGKTRLARELSSELGDRARVQETRCEQAGESTFAPIADLLRAGMGISETDTEDDVVAALASHLPIGDDDRDRIAARAAAVLGVGRPGSTEETFWAVRRLIEAAAAEQPVVLVLDDIHWAEPLLLDLIEYLAEWIRDAPVLVVGIGRPELRDLRPSFGEDGRAKAVIALEGLDEQAAAELALNLLEADELPEELLTRIPGSTQGNPLFVRELLRMLVDDGLLERAADGWSVTVDVDALQVPPTIQSLLSARVDRLRKDERSVVELASVVGTEFYLGALKDLAPPGLRELVDYCLERLARKEFVEPVGTYWINEPVYRFHHVLVRDAVYRRLLKASRADLHERVAEWLERKTADVLEEHDVAIGYHLEQAHDYKHQLDRPDDNLGTRAALMLGGAAKRALDRDDLPAAARLSDRALACLPSSDDTTRSELLLTRCEALLSMGDVAGGSAAVEDFEAVPTTPRLEAWATCFRGHLATLTAPERSEEIEARVAAAAAELMDLGDESGAAKAHTVHAQILAKRGQFAECEAVLDDALTAARIANDRRRITAALGLAPHVQVWGPNAVSQARGRCLDIERLSRITTESPAAEAASLRCEAVLEALRGRVDAARAMLRTACGTLTELGLDHDLLEAEHFAGIVELIDGDAAGAARHLHAAYEGFTKRGAQSLAAQSAALLARAHMALGEHAEAASFVDASERLGVDDLKATIHGLAVRGELAAERGSFADARRHADEAVRLAGRTDALFEHGIASRSQAAVLRAAGDTDGAAAADARALALFERKGATALSAPGAHAPEAIDKRLGFIPSAMPNNRCADVIVRVCECMNRGDIRGAMALFSDDQIHIDHRSEPHATDVGDDVESRGLVVARGGTSSSTLIATRGDKLALVKTHWEAPRPGGAVEHLSVVEINDDDQVCRVETFDIVADRYTAVPKLDELYAAREGIFAAECILVNRQMADAMHSADWDDLRSVLSDDFVLKDHRPASMGTIGPDDWISALRVRHEITGSYRALAVAYVRVASDTLLYDTRVTGFTNDGAEFESAMFVVALCFGGRLARMDLYPAAHLKTAIARFEELCGPERATLSSPTS